MSSVLIVSLVTAFNQEEALVEAFSVIVKYSFNLRLKLYCNDVLSITIYNFITTVSTEYFVMVR